MFCIFVTGLLYAYNKLVRKRGMTLEEARQHYWKHGLIKGFTMPLSKSGDEALTFEMTSLTLKRPESSGQSLEGSEWYGGKNPAFAHTKQKQVGLM